MSLSPVQHSNPWAYAKQADFAGSLQAALPPGDAWNGPVLAAVLEGCATAFSQLHGRARNLSEVEIVPSTTTQLLPFWEADFGLPDCCTPLGATLQQRRGALLAKIAEVGGQSAAYFISVAAALGFRITVSQGSLGSYIWYIHVVGAVTPILFRAGQSEAGDDLTEYESNTQLECVMRQIAPAHAILNFIYGS
jgi:uncharacterized protein YmfQ (DUF2313 family)